MQLLDWQQNKTQVKHCMACAVKILENYGRIAMVQEKMRLPLKRRISTYMNTEGDTIRSAPLAPKVAHFLDNPESVALTHSVQKLLLSHGD
jgi:hypothetical protein